MLVPVALLLETLQGLTPDRTPDLPTAFAAAAGVLAAAALAYLLTAAFRALKRRKNGPGGRQAGAGAAGA